MSTALRAPRGEDVRHLPPEARKGRPRDLDAVVPQLAVAHGPRHALRQRPDQRPGRVLALHHQPHRRRRLPQRPGRRGRVPDIAAVHDGQQLARGERASCASCEACVHVRWAVHDTSDRRLQPGLQGSFAILRRVHRQGSFAKFAIRRSCWDGGAPHTTLWKSEARDAANLSCS